MPLAPPGQEFALAYFNRGSAYRSKGEPDAALADFDRAIDLYHGLDPTQTQVRQRLGKAYHERGNSL